MAVPMPPAKLGQAGRTRWNRTAEILISGGLLTPLDLDGLEMYCRAWDDVADCDNSIEEHGSFFKADSGYIGQHPAVNRRFKALDVIRRFHDSFGMTPKARNAVTVASAGTTNEDAEGDFFG